MTTKAELDVDPRVLRTRRVVRQAVIEELAAVGYSGFTVESVAARAQVGKSTIYRHWSDRADLIIDALEALNQQPEPEVSGSPRERVEQLLTHLAEVMASSPFSACVPALVEAAERDPNIAELYHRYSESRRWALRDAIVRGIADGSFSPHLDPELASQALVGAIVYRRVMTDTPMAPEELSQLMTTVLDAG